MFALYDISHRRMICRVRKVGGATQFVLVVSVPQAVMRLCFTSFLNANCSWTFDNDTTIQMQHCMNFLVGIRLQPYYSKCTVNENELNYFKSMDKEILFLTF